MFTVAAFTSLASAIIVYGIVAAIYRRDRRMVVGLLVLAISAAGLAAGALRAVATNSDPIALIRQPAPCSVRTGC
jgi:hypothetical protein